MTELDRIVVVEHRLWQVILGTRQVDLGTRHLLGGASPALQVASVMLRDTIGTMPIFEKLGPAFQVTPRVVRVWDV